MKKFKFLLVILLSNSLNSFCAQQKEIIQPILLDFSEFQGKEDVRDVQIIITEKQTSQMFIIPLEHLNLCYLLNTNNIIGLSIKITQVNSKNKKLFVKFKGSILPGSCYKFLYKKPDSFKNEEEILQFSLCEICKDSIKNCTKLN